MISKEKPQQEEDQCIRQIHQYLAIRFFSLCFKLCTYNQKVSKDNADIIRFIEIYHQKSEEIRCQTKDHLSKKESQQPMQNTDLTNQILKALEVPGSEQSFIRFFSKNHEKIFKEKEYNGFKCSPEIICRAILYSKNIYCAGSERSAQKLIRILINFYQQKAFNLKNASNLYSIGAHLSIIISDHKTAYARLRSALRIRKDSMMVNFQLIHLYLRDFKFDSCYEHFCSNKQFLRDNKFKAIRLFTAACMDPSRPKREKFILTMQEDHEYPREYPKGLQDFYKKHYEKYYDFESCCGYFQYLALEYEQAYSYFKKEFDLRNTKNSIEGMCLCSYRQKDYGRALDQIDQMRHLMPYESGWKLTIAAVCYFKLGDEKKATAMLGKVNEASLTFEEDVFYCGVLCLVGQPEKAIKRLSALPQHANSILNTQRAIVMLLCEQRQGNTAQANRILESLPYLEQNEQSIDHRYMEFQQALFLANYCFERNRFAEGRHYVRKIRRMGESLRKIARAQAVQRLMEEFNEQKKVEVELIFR